MQDFGSENASIMMGHVKHHYTPLAQHSSTDTDGPQQNDQKRTGRHRSVLVRLLILTNVLLAFALGGTVFLAAPSLQLRERVPTGFGTWP